MRIAIRTLVVLMAILSSLAVEEKPIQLPKATSRSDMPVVGLMLEQLKAGVGIFVVFKNSPADRAGLRAGDILLKVNGTDASGMEPASVSKLMDEKKAVELEVKSRDGKVKTVRLQKGSLKQMQDGKGDIAVASSLGPLRELEPGDLVPNITAQYPDGRQITLSEWRGKVVLVLFWDSQRESCAKVLPDWVRLYQKYQPLGLEILGVSLDTDKVALDRFISDHHVPWPQHFDGLAARGGVVRDWGALMPPPLCVLVDKNVRLLRESVPQLILEEVIREALGLMTDADLRASPLLSGYFSHPVSLIASAALWPDSIPPRHPRTSSFFPSSTSSATITRPLRIIAPPPGTITSAATP